MIDISVIILNYNYSKFISKCVKSCLNQNGKLNYEIIIIDDGSTDNSKSIINRFKDNKIKKFFLKRSGIENSSNFGFKKSKGKYIIRVDSDDYLHKDFLINTYKKIREKKNISFVYTDYFLVDKKKRKIEIKKLPDFDVKEIFQRGDFLATGTLYRKSTLTKNGYYRTKYKNSGLENYELILRLLIKRYKGLLIKKALFYHTRHVKNMSLVKTKKIKKFGNFIFKKYNLGTYRINKNHPYLN